MNAGTLLARPKRFLFLGVAIPGLFAASAIVGTPPASSQECPPNLPSPPFCMDRPELLQKPTHGQPRMVFGGVIGTMNRAGKKTAGVLIVARPANVAPQQPLRVYEFDVNGQSLASRSQPSGFDSNTISSQE